MQYKVYVFTGVQTTDRDGKENNSLSPRPRGPQVT